MTHGSLARLQCAAITRGCTSSLVIPLSHSADTASLDAALESDARAAELLAVNGWHLDHGRWVCGAHERTAPCEHQDSEGRLLPECR